MICRHVIFIGGELLVTVLVSKYQNFKDLSGKIKTEVLHTSSTMKRKYQLLRAILDILDEIEVSCPYWSSNPRPSSP